MRSGPWAASRVAGWIRFSGPSIAISDVATSARRCRDAPAGAPAAAFASALTGPP